MKSNGFIVKQWALIKRLFPFLAIDRPLQVEQMLESPAKHQARTLYLIGEDGKYWFVEMLCPCGCGELIQLKLIGNSPVWNLSIDAQGQVTLRPSVWRTKRCKSHFFVRQSHIIWTGSTR